MSIAARLAEVREHIDRACVACGRDPGEVELLAVSKTHSEEAVREAFAAGQRAFGENKIQELAGKAESLSDLDLQWHAIGSVQTNKLRQLCKVPGLAMIHSIDREKLVRKLAMTLEETGGEVDVLLQVHATDEETKHGALPAEVPALADAVVAAGSRLRLQGLMAIGPLDSDSVPAFALVARLREELRDRLGLPLPVLSMGMTGDLDEAVAAGSTMVRVGTGVFGPREY